MNTFNYNKNDNIYDTNNYNNNNFKFYTSNQLYGFSLLVIKC